MPEIPDIAKSRLKQAPPETHPDADLLAAFAEQRLNAPERQSVLKHLSACAACREIVHLSLPEQDAAQTGGITAARSLGWMPWLRWSALAATVAIAASITLYMQRTATHDQTPTLSAGKAVPSSEMRQAVQPTVPAAGSSSESLQQKKKNAETLPASPARQDKESAAMLHGTKTLNGRPWNKTISQPASPARQEFDRLANVSPGVPRDAQSKDQAKSKAVPPPPPPPPAESAAAFSKAESANEVVVVTNNEPKAASEAAPESALHRQRRTMTAEQSGVAAGRLETAAKSANSAKTDNASADEIVALPQQTRTSFVSRPFTAPAWRVDKDKDNGKLLVADNGAWMDVHFPPTIPVRDVIEQPAGELWVVTADGRLYHSTNHSSPWQPVQGGWTQKATGLVFLSSNVAHVILEKEVWVTRDGGKTWAKQAKQ